MRFDVIALVFYFEPRELLIDGFQLLQKRNVGRRFVKPFKYAWKPCFYRIYIECSNFHDRLFRQKKARIAGSFLSCLVLDHIENEAPQRSPAVAFGLFT